MMEYQGMFNEQILFNCINDIEKYECKTCPNFQTNFATSLKCHILDGHKIQNLEEDTYKCLKCYFVTYSKYLMVRHSLLNKCGRRTEIEKEKRFIRYRSSQSKLIVTIKDEPENSFHKERGETHWFKFKQCLNKFEGISNQKSLVNSVPATPRDLFHCTQCSYKCKTKRHLKQHHLYSHTRNEDIRRFKCEYCPYKGKTKSHLQSHVFYCHTKPEAIPWFDCKHCPSKFKQKQNLKTHIMSCHTKPERIQWFSCEHCPYKCKTKGNLKSHISFCHTDAADIQWFECEQCPARFRQKLPLKKHISSSHENVR